MYEYMYIVRVSLVIVCHVKYEKNVSVYLFCKVKASLPLE